MFLIQNTDRRRVELRKCKWKDLTSPLMVPVRSSEMCTLPATGIGKMRLALSQI